MLCYTIVNSVRPVSGVVLAERGVLCSANRVRQDMVRISLNKARDSQLRVSLSLSMYIRIYTYTCIDVHMYKYLSLYIYIYIEREGERYVCVHGFAGSAHCASTVFARSRAR